MLVSLLLAGAGLSGLKADVVAARVAFGARESASPPRLVQTLAQSQQGPRWHVLKHEYPDLDTTRLVQLPGDTFFLYRTDITVRFKDTVSDSAKAAFFARHSIQVLGVTPSEEFFVRIPDPGTSAAALFAAVAELGADPNVLVAASIPRTPLPQREDARFPTDGPGESRASWRDRSRSTWAMRAIRAPLLRCPGEPRPLHPQPAAERHRNASQAPAGLDPEAPKARPVLAGRAVYS